MRRQTTDTITHSTYAIFFVALVVSNAFTWWMNINITTANNAQYDFVGSGGHITQDRSPPPRKFHREFRSLSATDPFTVDILSVGSVNRSDYLDAQRRTFASHNSVRNFFYVTEKDDADSDCATEITWNHVKMVSGFCKRRNGRGGPGEIYRGMSNWYARINWLQKKSNPVGWLCAQPRPFAGLMKALSHYETTGQDLPHYFLIMDDDSYVNVELLRGSLGNSTEWDTYYAGCLVRFPVHEVNFTMPYGGYGSILGTDVLKNMFRSIPCGSGAINEAVEGRGSSVPSGVCRRLKENNVNELKYFESGTGMNLVELMYKYATTERYRDVSNWKRGSGGFCMHSDWVSGFPN